MSLFENDSYKLGLTLAISWIVFGAWEIYVFLWAQDIEGPIIRVDLILILPALLLISAYCLWHMINADTGYRKY